MIGCTSYDSTDDWPWPMPISFTAYAHFAARMGAFFYRTRFIWSTMYRSNFTDVNITHPFDQQPKELIYSLNVYE